MKSGFILILAAFLVLASSAVIELPPNDPSGSEERGGLLRWPSYRPVWDLNSPFVSKFDVKGNTVKRISKEDQWYQILVSALPCQAKTKASFKVKSYGGKEHGLFFGIISENRYLEKQSQGVYDDTCALFSKPSQKEGNIYMNGNDVQSSAGWNADWFVPEGSIVDIEVDLLLGYITFTNRATWAVQKIFLPASTFKGPNIYLFVNAYYPNASFELL